VTCSRAAKASRARTKALLIGSIRAEEANGCPRWYRKKAATPRSVWRRGTYTFEYIRSMLSTSRVTW
jgi:hypothetical protein